MGVGFEISYAQAPPSMAEAPPSVVNSLCLPSVQPDVELSDTSPPHICPCAAMLPTMMTVDEISEM